VSLKEIRIPILHELEEVENEFQKILQSDVELITNVVHHVTSAKGKRIRPIILLLSSGMIGEITHQSIQAATIIELLHTATLIHDDVVDDSDMRRGAPSVNNIWNNKISVLLGDYMFSSVLFCMSKLNNPDITHVLVDVARKMSKGELLQLQYGKNYQMEESTYFQLIRNKTASLLAASCELGAVTSRNEDTKNYENLRKFGEYLGIAFQIKDDLLDLTGKETEIGKPVAKDLIGNTMTLPILYGLRNTSMKNREYLISLMNNGLNIKDVELLKNFVREVGGIDYAVKKADHYITEAYKCLERYEDSKYKQSLVQLSQFILHREN